MQIFIDVIKLFATILAPGIVATLFYIVNKKVSWFNNLNKYIKGIIIGSVFAVTTILPCYCGMKYMNVFTFEYEVKGSFGPMLASPIIASIIFGWVAGLTSGVVGGIWRFFIVSIYYKDYLRIGDTVSIICAALLGIIILKFVFRKKDGPTPKWTYGIVLALIAESIHLLLTFPIITIKYNDIDFAHEIVYYTDWILYLSTVISICLSFLWLNIYNKQKIRVFGKQTNLVGHVQKRLTLLFLIAIFITFSTTCVTSYVKAYSDASSDLVLSSEDVINELIDVSETFGFPNVDVINSITLNRRVRTKGFVVIASAKDQDLISVLNTQQSNDTKIVPTKKNELISVPNVEIGFLGELLYINNDKNMTIDKVLTETKTFKDKEEKKYDLPSSGIFRCYFRDEEKKKNIRYLGHAYKTPELPGVSTQSNEYYVCSFLTIDEAADAVLVSLKTSMYYEILIYSLIYLLIFKFIRRKFVDNIDSINDSLSRISSGKLNTKVNVKDYEEFTSLSNDINHTVDVLKGYIADANKRIDDELRYAKTIQMNSIPIVFPTSKYFDLHASMITAKQVGGDFYDFFFIDDNHLFFMVADVSGKGIPAAMFMMRSKTLVNALAQTKELTLDQIVDNVNDELNVDNKAGMFVTAYVGILDITNGKITYVNAGHTRPLIKTKSGDVSYLQMKTNTVLGVIPGYKYGIQTTYLKPGDQILLYTDGVTEAMNKKRKLYGEERLMNLFKKNNFSDSHEAIDTLNNELAIYQKGVEQADDITILSLIYKPKK